MIVVGINACKCFKFMRAFLFEERTIIRFLIGVISALVLGGIIISIPSTVRIVLAKVVHCQVRLYWKCLLLRI